MQPLDRSGVALDDVAHEDGQQRTLRPFIITKWEEFGAACLDGSPALLGPWLGLGEVQSWAKQ